MYMGFDKLKAGIAGQGGIRDPAAVTASIGRRKYGSASMSHASVLGRKRGHGAAKAYLEGLHS